MANLFRSVPIKKPPRSGFDLSHMFKFTCNEGELVPIYCEPVYPGDKARVSSDIMIRLAPMLYPIYERINVYTHFFFVPMRLIWSDWEKFITGGKDGKASVAAPTISFGNEPYKSSTGTVSVVGYGAQTLFGSKSLMTYLGVADVSNDYVDHVLDTPQNEQVRQFFDALPFRAYMKVWNDYYRDETFNEDIFDTYENILTGNGNTTVAQLFGLLQETIGTTGRGYAFAHRAWEKDYFTSALPWAQRGSSVDIPMGDISIPAGGKLEYNPLGTPTVIRDGAASYIPNGANEFLTAGMGGPSISSGTLITRKTDGSSAGINLKADITSHTQVGPLSGKVEPATINSLRRAFKLQTYLENMARGGYRYIEQIFSHFGVKSSDSRLQRAEYLGGGISPVVVSEVLQQSQGTQESPLGNFAGHGISVQKTNQFKRFFEEHGIVIGIMSVMPKPGYFGGMSRKWNKTDRLDYYWPEFAHIGEQPIYNRELALVPNEENRLTEDGHVSSYNNGTFGYTPRYAEYKFSHDRIGGDFAGSLNSWHQARFFGLPDGANDISKPTLSKSFIFQPPTTRIFANTNDRDDHLWVQVYHQALWSRPMPKFGTPRI